MLSLYECGEAEKYQTASISVFDHWLDKDEAIACINCVSTTQETKHNQLLHKFAVLLSGLNETYLVKMRGKNAKRKAIFKEFTSEAGMNKSLITRHHLASDMSRFTLLLPNLNAVYFEGSDFTHHIYYKNKKDLEFISKIANDVGLSII